MSKSDYLEAITSTTVSDRRVVVTIHEGRGRSTLSPLGGVGSASGIEGRTAVSGIGV